MRTALALTLTSLGCILGAVPHLAHAEPGQREPDLVAATVPGDPPALATAEALVAEMRRESERLFLGADDAAISAHCEQLHALAHERGQAATHLAAMSALEAECYERLARSDEARSAWRRLLEHEPSHFMAHRAIARLRFYERRGVGSPILDALDEIRRSYLQLGSDEAIRRVEALLLQTSDSQEQAELLLWLAEEHLALRTEYGPATARYEQVLELDGLRIGQYYKALNGLLDIGLYTDQMLPARRAVDRFLRLRPDLAEEPLLLALRAWAAPMAWRGTVRSLAYGFLALFLTCLLWARAWRAAESLRDGRWRPLPGALVLVWLFGGAGLLAEGWDHGFLAAFWTAGLGSLFVYLLSGAWAHASPPRSTLTLTLRSLLGALATLSVIYLAIDAFNLHAIVGL